MPNTKRTKAMRFNRKVDDTAPELSLLSAIGERACCDVRGLLKHGVLKPDGSIGEIPIGKNGYPVYILDYYCNKQRIQEVLDLFKDDGEFSLMKTVMGIQCRGQEILAALGMEIGVDKGEQPCDNTRVDNENGGMKDE